MNGVQTERNCQKDFFRNRKRSGSLRIRAGGLQGPHKPLAAARGPAPPRLVGSLGHLCPRSFAYIFPKIPEKMKRSTKILFCRRKLLSPKIPSRARSGALQEGGFGYGGLLHQHHDLSDDALVVHHRPTGP